MSTLHALVRNKSPYKIFFNGKPDTKYLKLYGSKVFVRVPENKRNSKWDRKTDLEILIGYDIVGYRVLIGNRIIVARYVDVIEEDVECIGLNDRILEKENSNESFEQDVNVNNKENENLENLNENDKNEVEEVPELRRAQRNIKTPGRFDDNFVYSGCI